MAAVSPCVHPNCRDAEGNRRLVTANMCDPCQGQLHRDLEEIVNDFNALKSFLPLPARRSQAVRRHGVQLSFGHPAQDASDACTEIAWDLNLIETDLRTWVGDRPAPELVRTCSLSLVRTAESLLVDHAARYLAGHFEQLCQWPDVGAHAGALHDTHQTNRRVYGLTRQVERLQLRCPGCDVAVLVRDVGAVPVSGGPARTRIACEHCGQTLSEQEYARLAWLTIAQETRVDEAEHAAAAEALAPDPVPMFLRQDSTKTLRGCPSTV